MKSVTDETFNADVIIRSETLPVIVDLWAPWCEPCKSLTPILETVVARSNGAIELVGVNIDENPQIRQTFQVQSIPAVYAFKNGAVCVLRLNIAMFSVCIKLCFIYCPIR